MQYVDNSNATEVFCKSESEEKMQNSIILIDTIIPYLVYRKQFVFNMTKSKRNSNGNDDYFSFLCTIVFQNCGFFFLFHYRYQGIHRDNLFCTAKVVTLLNLSFFQYFYILPNRLALIYIFIFFLFIFSPFSTYSSYIF